MLNDHIDGIKYAQRVSDRDIVACKWVRLSCERFLRDLDNHTAGWYFDEDKAQHICSFFEDAIRHVTGTLAGEPYKLSPWETFILINLFGFVSKTDGKTRRFHEAIVFVARKNSKSTLGSGVVIYHLLADNEEGAQIFSVATQRDQAKIVWKSAGRMIQKMPKELGESFSQTVSEIAVREFFNTYTPLGRDSKSLDGLNPSMALFDEAAAITDRNMFEVITSGQGSRENYLNLRITTAQDNKETLFFEDYSYCKRILEGEVEDDNWFAVLYELDENDRWDDEEVWIKANPNLGQSVKLSYLQKGCNEAKEVVSKRNNFLIKNMNIWTSTSEAWLPKEMWEKCTIDKIDTSGHLWVGMDLGATDDLTALTFLYRNDGVYHMDYQCFRPEGAMKNKTPKHLKDIYQKAIASGKLHITPGDATDYSIVKSFLLEYIKDKDLKEIAFDPWKATQLVTELGEEGAPCVQVGQGMKPLSPGVDALEVHIMKEEILHLDDPFLQWQFENCTVYRDMNKNSKVKKGDDNNLKIDTIIALITAMTRASSNGGLKKATFGIYTA